eukprot:366050-Chlamydomonas_euryale.AAC.8
MGPQGPVNLSGEREGGIAGKQTGCSCGGQKCVPLTASGWADRRTSWAFAPVGDVEEGIYAKIGRVSTRRQVGWEKMRRRRTGQCGEGSVGSGRDSVGRAVWGVGGTVWGVCGKRGGEWRRKKG